MMIIIKCGDTFPKSCSLYSKDVDHCCLEALKTSKVHLLSGMKIEGQARLFIMAQDREWWSRQLHISRDGKLQVVQQKHYTGST